MDGGSFVFINVLIAFEKLFLITDNRWLIVSQSNNGPKNK